MNLAFRPATERDAAVIRSLLETSKLPTEVLSTNVASFYVSELDGRVIGTAAFEFYGKDALLRSVAIAPELRGRGLGSQLVDFMEEEAKKRSVMAVVLLTETARKFFEHKGYGVVDRPSITNEEMRKSSEFVYACSESAVCMVKRL